MAGSIIRGGVSPTLCCGAHNGVQPKIIVYEERCDIQGKVLAPLGGGVIIISPLGSLPVE